MGPLAIAIAALAAGTGMNIMAQRQRDRAASRAYGRYSKKLDEHTARATELFEDALKGQDRDTALEAIEQAAADKVSRVEQLVEDSDAYVDPVIAGQERAPAVIRSEASSRLADELARARAQIAALAKLEGYSTRTFDRGLQLNRYKPELVNLGLFAEGARNTLDADMLRAEHKGQGLQMLGDLLTGAGQLGLGVYAGGPLMRGKVIRGGVPMTQSSTAIDSILSGASRVA